jgi:prohibitin 2
MKEPMDPHRLPIGRLVAASSVALVALIVLLNAFVQIPAGHIGVVTQFGAATGQEFPAGLHVKVPLVQDVIDFDTKTQVDTVDINDAASSDLQTINGPVALNYNLDPRYVSLIYRTIGPNYDAVILDPNFQGLVRTVISHFTAQEIITKRALATQEAEAVLKARLAPSHIVVTGLNLVNLHFSAAFEQAVEQKVVAQQRLAQIGYEAQQKVTQAHADAQARIERAQGEAQGILLEAHANATAQKLQLQTLTPLYLQLQALKQWDGHLPTYTGSAGPLPFIGATPGAR